LEGVKEELFPLNLISRLLLGPIYVRVPTYTSDHLSSHERRRPFGERKASLFNGANRVNGNKPS
jgi:hypothetical protein